MSKEQSELPKFDVELHKKYVLHLDAMQESKFEYWATEHLRKRAALTFFVNCARFSGVNPVLLFYFL